MCVCVYGCGHENCKKVSHSNYNRVGIKTMSEITFVPVFAVCMQSVSAYGCASACLSMHVTSIVTMELLDMVAMS